MAGKKKKAVKKKAGKKRKVRRGKKNVAGMLAIRYTTSKKKQAVAFVKKYNAKNGRGGLAAAVRKFGVSPLTISRWLKKFR